MQLIDSDSNCGQPVFNIERERFQCDDEGPSSQQQKACLARRYLLAEYYIISLCLFKSSHKWPA